MTARRRLGGRIGYAALALVTIGALAIGTQHTGGPSVQERIAHLESIIKCPECADLTIAQSQSSSAQGLRTTVAAMVRAGDSDAQVEAFVVGKYGEEEIIAPHGLSGWIAIGIPAVGFVVAAGALVAGVLRRRRLSSTPTVPREVDLALVDQALRDRRAVR